MDDTSTDKNKSMGVASEVLSTKNPCAEVIKDGTFRGSHDPFEFAYSIMVQYIGATPEEFGLLSWQAMRDKMRQELRGIFEAINKTK